MNLTENIVGNSSVRLISASVPLLTIPLVLGSLRIEESAQFFLLVMGLRYVQLFDLSLSATVTRLISRYTYREGFSFAIDTKLISLFTSLFLLFGFIGCVVFIPYLLLGLRIDLSGVNIVLVVCYILIDFIAKVFKCHWSVVARPYISSVPNVASNLVFLWILYTGENQNLQFLVSLYLSAQIIAQLFAMSHVAFIWSTSSNSVVRGEEPRFRNIIGEMSVTSLISIGSILFRFFILFVIARLATAQEQVVATLSFQILTFITPFLNVAAPLASSVFAVSDYKISSVAVLKRFFDLWRFSIAFCSMGLLAAMLGKPQLLAWWLSERLTSDEIAMLSALLTYALVAVQLLVSVNLLRNFLVAQRLIQSTAIIDFSILVCASLAVTVWAVDARGVFQVICLTYFVRLIGLLSQLRFFCQVRELSIYLINTIAILAACSSILLASHTSIFLLLCVAWFPASLIATLYYRRLADITTG